MSSYPQPALQPEQDQKKTAVATELAPVPRTCGELWGYVESWSDEVSYLSQHPDKYETELAYAKYMAAKFAWCVLELRKRPEYTSEFRFETDTIDALLQQFDDQFPDKIAPEHKRLPEELDKLFGNVKDVVRNLNDKLKAGKPISSADLGLAIHHPEPEWDTGSTYQDDFEAMKDYEDEDGEYEGGNSLVGI